MSTKKIKYGIMGGTFDPIHIGHLVLAEEIRNKLKLNKVIFVPTGNPPHKESNNLTDSKHRYLMTLLATLSNPYFEVSAYEVNKKGITYTIDTIKAFKEKYNGNTDFYFITGADAILELSTWKDIDQLLELCKFIAATRPGFELEEMEREINRLGKKYNKSIYTIPVAALRISSTNIRERIRENRTTRYLLPDNVINYIKKNDLYKEGI